VLVRNAIGVRKKDNFSSSFLYAMVPRGRGPLPMLPNHSCSMAGSHIRSVVVRAVIHDDHLIAAAVERLFAQCLKTMRDPVPFVPSGNYYGNSRVTAALPLVAVVSHLAVVDCR
jgi:hypothetical protein